MSTKIVYILSHMPKPRKTAAFSLSSMEKVIYQNKSNRKEEQEQSQSRPAGRERKKEAKKENRILIVL